MDAIKITKVNGVTLAKISGPPSPSSPKHFPRGPSSVILGTLHLTTHHLIFHGSDELDPKELWLPYPLLWSVTKLPSDLTGKKNPIEIRLRDFEAFVLVMRDEQDATDVWESLRNISQGMDSLTQLYAFYYTPSITSSSLPPSAYWSLYSPIAELARMGVSSSDSNSRTSAWRFTSVNQDFSYCPTYPAQIAVPSRISDATLNYAVKYRSKGRIPGLVYLHWGNLASITRSSQPMVGLKNNRSIQDEKLIECIFTSHAPSLTSSSNLATGSASTSLTGGYASTTYNPEAIYGATATNLIIDARPTTNAVANVAKGAGTENMDYYRGCRKVYLGIDNIHVMRDSLNKLNEALKLADSTGVIDRTLLRRTNWLKHLSNILEGTLTIVKNIHISSSHVLVHCSDGWDRTSQLCALPQLCLDSFYRTGYGFAILVEKDWLSYGHRFGDRTGHLVKDRTTFDVKSPNVPDGERGYMENGAAFLSAVQKRFESQSHGFKETCPVFLQFLDCVWQVMRQFPKRFEYNELFLRRLGYHVFSCQYGTFLWNSEKERGEETAGIRTRSVWEEFLEGKDTKGEWKLKAEYRNKDYEPGLDEREKGKRGEGADLGVLLVDPKDVKFWYTWFGREDEEMNFREDTSSAKTEPDPEIVVENSKEDSFMIHHGFLAESLKRTQSLSLPKVSLGKRQANPTAKNLEEDDGIAAAQIQEKLQSGFQNALKWGGSTWKTVSAKYTDALNQLNAAQPASDTDLTTSTQTGRQAMVRSGSNDFLPEKAVEEKVSRKGMHGRERSIQFRSGEVSLIQDGWNEIHSPPSHIPKQSTLFASGSSTITRSSRSATETLPSGLGRAGTISTFQPRGHSPSASVQHPLGSTSRHLDSRPLSQNPWAEPSSARSISKDPHPLISSTVKNQPFVDPLTGASGSSEPNPWSTSQRLRHNPSPTPSSTSSRTTEPLGLTPERLANKPLPTPSPPTVVSVLAKVAISNSSKGNSSTAGTSTKTLDPLGVL